MCKNYLIEEIVTYYWNKKNKVSKTVFQLKYYIHLDEEEKPKVTLPYKTKSKEVKVR